MLARRKKGNHIDIHLFLKFQRKSKGQKSTGLKYKTNAVKSKISL